MRPFSTKFLAILDDPATEWSTGLELARLCVAANIPTTYVAAALEVTRATVYNWFRGQDIRKKKRKMVELLMEHLKGDLHKGVLPAKDQEAAKRYIEELTGIPI